MLNRLYVFGGEKASGAEIVIERLMRVNTGVKSHLFIAPGTFSYDLIKKHQVYEITVLDKLKKLNRSNSSAISFYLKALLNYFSVSYSTYKYIKKNKINVVHANTVVPASYLLPLIMYDKLFSLNVKWVWSDHDLTYYSKLDFYLSSLCSKLYDYTLTVSDAVKNKYKASAKVVTLYNGLDTDIFRPDTSKRMAYRSHLGFAQDNLIFTIAATIAPRKGQLSLVTVFTELITAYPNIKLLIAGGKADDFPNYSNEVLTLVNKHSTNIIYLGKVTDMIALYNASDVVISNSSANGSEPLGTTIYEAMAFEKIVVASNTGGSKEIIDDKISGFLFEADDMHELKSIIVNIVNSFNNLEQLKLNARRKVIERFNIETMSNKYNQIVNFTALNN